MIESRESGVTIRDVRPEELREISDLIFEAYKQYQDNLPPDAWDHYVRDITDVEGRLPVSELIVAEYQGKLAGGITVMAYRLDL